MFYKCLIFFFYHFYLIIYFYLFIYLFFITGMYTSHRPWLAEKDYNFFTIAQEQFNFKVEKMFDTKMKVMFEEGNLLE